MAKDRFERGGPGVFRCATCGRGTRMTTQPSGSQLCGDCDELAMTENSVLDGATVAEVAEFRDDMVAAIVKKGGSLEMLKENFATLWEDK